MRAVVGLFVIATLIGCGQGAAERGLAPGQVVQRPGQPAVVGLGAHDPGIVAAAKKAQTGLPGFIKRLAHRKPTEEFAVKTAFHTSQPGNEEHIWVNGLSHSGSMFKGALANEPLDIPGEKFGSPVEVQDADVEDWIIASNGGKKVEGGFSMAAVAAAAGKD
jgi:uncharacterized protein YegJ (DUF2314 family)